MYSTINEIRTFKLNLTKYECHLELENRSWIILKCKIRLAVEKFPFTLYAILKSNALSVNVTMAAFLGKKYFLSYIENWQNAK